MTPEAKTFVTADKREFTFLFDIEGLIAAEDCANGVDGNANLQQIIRGAANKRLGYLRALVYGGLKTCHPAITREQAWALIDSDGKALGEAFWLALFSALPPQEEAGGDGEANPPIGEAAPGTGSRSSPRGSKKASPKKGSGGKRRGATRS